MNKKELKKNYCQKYYQEHKEEIKQYHKGRKEQAQQVWKKYYLEHKVKIKQYQKKYNLEHKEERSKKGKEYYSKYYQEHKEQISQQGKKYYQKHKEQISQRTKKYEREHRERRNQCRREKRKVNINYKLSAILRARIHKVLKGKVKSAHTLELLGCTIPELKEYLENQFEPGMTWSNIHIDHHIPLSYPGESLAEPFWQYYLCNYKNLRPMFAKENISKNNKIKFVKNKLEVE